MAARDALIVIVGPTASGKTALAIDLAKRFNGEIIAADSRTIYKGMDIGTAKPSAEEQAEVRHHLLDIAEPSQKFTAARFKELALDAIDGIRRRGKLPIMVGGSGLYIDSVIFDYGFAEPHEAEKRAPENPRHLDPSVGTTRRPLGADTLVIGLNIGKEVLRQRVTDRVEIMLRAGLPAEARRLAGRYGWEAPALQAPGYKAMRKHLEGAISLDEAKNEFIKNDLQLAKRQRTWFRRNKSIHWINHPSEAVDIITTFLSKMNN